MSESARAFAPATVANVGSAFDILGFALEAPGDFVTASRSDAGPGVTVSRVVSPYGEIPADPEKNTASVAVRELFCRKNIEAGVVLEVEKQMPLGSGLGSSAASAAAALVAVTSLLSIEVPEEDLVACAMEAERAACGTAHADNVAPSLLGGIVLIRSYNPIDIVKIHPGGEIFYTVVCPRVEVRTEDARKVLRREVQLRDAIVQMGNVAGLITGLLSGDVDLVGRSLQDVLIEPYRAALIPCFDSAKKAAIESGAVGGGISGSGPSIFALSRCLDDANRSAKAMCDVFEREGIESLSFTGTAGSLGARIME